MYTQNAQRHTEASYITVPIILSWNITITTVHHIPALCAKQLFSYTAYIQMSTACTLCTISANYYVDKNI